MLEPMDLGKLHERAQFLLGLDDVQLLQEPTSYPRRIRFPALVQANLIDGRAGRYVEMANLLPEPVTITAIRWRNRESGVSRPVEFAEEFRTPFEIAPTIHGQAPKFYKMYIADGGDADELVITADYGNWPQEREIIPTPYFSESPVNPVPSGSVSALLAAHPFISRSGSANELMIRQGVWQVDSDIVVPAGFTLSASQGTTLEFAEGVALISFGALQFVGAEDNPITLKGVASGNWQGLAVIRAGQKSLLSHVDVSNTSGIHRGAWQLTGGVSFYRSDVDMDDVSIKGHQGEDALNIIRSHFDISRLSVDEAFSDGFDADFTTGEIRDSEFSNIGQNTGGDAIDLSGSDVVIDGIRFESIADKAISVGEASTVRATNLTMTHVGTAAASKDGSHLDIGSVVINDVLFAGLMAYTKKPEYGPATINAENIDYKPTGPVGRVQTGSVIELDGELLEPEDLDVDLLYETVMRKGN